MAAGEEDDVEYDFEYSDDDEAEPDVEVENAFYAAKGQKGTDAEAALRGFQQVVAMEAQRGQRGDWGFKALKQSVKLLFGLGRHEEMLARYGDLLDYATAPSTNGMDVSGGSNGGGGGPPAVTQNVAEKGIDSILDHVSSSSSTSTALLHRLYDTTLARFDHKGTTHQRRHERLWFKTNLKLGHLLLREVGEGEGVEGEEGQGLVPSVSVVAVGRLHRVVRELLRSCEGSGSGEEGEAGGADSVKRGAQLLEVYALQMQLHSLRRDSRRLKELYQQAVRVTWGVPHPRTLGLLQECGGKMYMGERDYDRAVQAFFQSFKSYDEAGDPRRLTLLKYLVLASMLHKSTIDPFDSQEARAYKEEREVVAVRRLIEAFQHNDVAAFERILQTNRASIMGDDFIRAHIGDLLRTARTQALLRAIAPYDRVALSHLAHELNGVPEADVEALLVSLILDGAVHGYIDQLQRILVRGDRCSTSSHSLRRYVPSTIVAHEHGPSSTSTNRRFLRRPQQQQQQQQQRPPPLPPSQPPESLPVILGTNEGRKERLYRAIGRMAEALADVGGQSAGLGGGLR